MIASSFVFEWHRLHVFNYLLSSSPSVLGLNGTDDGFSREQFEEIIEFAVDTFTPALPDPERAGILKAAMDFQYSPWPYINDGNKNRYQIGEVGGQGVG